MTVFIKNSTFCKSSHNLIYVKIYINQSVAQYAPTPFHQKCRHTLM